MCAEGSSFRDAFDSWYERCQSVTSEIHRVRNLKPVGRRQENRAFTDSLTVLWFPSAAHLYQLFLYENCEGATELGQKYCDEIAVDGTATGILGNLPEFKRWTETLSCVSSGVSMQQYLMPNPKNRQFVDSILISAQK